MKKNEYKNKILENIPKVDILKNVKDYAILKNKEQSVESDNKKGFNYRLFYRLSLVCFTLFIGFMVIGSLNNNSKETSDNAPSNDSKEENVEKTLNDFINYYHGRYNIKNEDDESKEPGGPKPPSYQEKTLLTNSQLKNIYEEINAGLSPSAIATKLDLEDYLVEINDLYQYLKNK